MFSLRPRCSLQSEWMSIFWPLSLWKDTEGAGQRRQVRWRADRTQMMSRGKMQARRVNARQLRLKKTKRHTPLKITAVSFFQPGCPHTAKRRNASRKSTIDELGT